VPPKKELQGRTDQYIGSWLAGRKRQDVILASKVGHAAMLAMCAVLEMLKSIMVRPHSHSLLQNTWLYLFHGVSTRRLTPKLLHVGIRVWGADRLHAGQ
jgi:hypothetical protein